MKALLIALGLVLLTAAPAGARWCWDGIPGHPAYWCP